MTDNYLDVSVCRFCHDGGTAAQPLITPCGCSGSVANVHRECLEEWVKRSRSLVCELCGTPYATRSSPIWEVSLRGCVGLACDMSCSILFHHTGFMLGCLLFFCTWMNVRPAYFVGLAILVNITLFGMVASVCCSVAVEVIELTFAQQRGLRLIKNHVCPMEAFLMVPFSIIVVIVVRISSLNYSGYGGLSFGSLAALVTYSCLFVISVLFSYFVRLDEEDRGPPRCKMFLRMHGNLCRELLCCHWLRREIFNGCTVFMCCSERYIAFCQLLLLALRPYPSPGCDDRDMTLYRSSGCVKPDMECGLVWSCLLLGILAFASRVGDAARARLRPEDPTAQVVAQAIWIGIVLAQLTTLFKQLALVGSYSSPCSVAAIWAASWTFQNGLLLHLYLFIYGETLSVRVQLAWHAISWAFRARSEFCDATIANAANRHAAPLEQPLLV